MAASTCLLIFSAALLLFSSTGASAQSSPSFRPRALALFVIKDVSNNQYLATVEQRTPLVTINTVVDLGGQYLWIDCQEFYESSSYVPTRCRSAQCSLAGSALCISCLSPPSPGCNNNTCLLFPDNTVTDTTTIGELSQDVFGIRSTNGRNPGPAVTVPRFLFGCGSTFQLEGLAGGVRGMVGLGRGRIGLPSQLAAAFSFNRKFAICLPSSITGYGVIFFGNTPYIMLPDIDISASLTYTPLLINPVSTASASFNGDRSTEYFIGVRSIRVNGKSISVNSSLLTIQSNGFGGTKISTVRPYTVLETSIYNALTTAFVRESNLRRAASVEPFGFCFDSSNVSSTRAGPGVPSIDLVLQSESVYWRIYGANSMVQVRNGVLCLGFVDGGSRPRTSIVIGGHQLDDNLLQFDLATSRLGFSSSLLLRGTTCSNFNFTDSP